MKIEYLENELVVVNFIESLNREDFKTASEYVHEDFRLMEEGLEYFEFYKDIAPNLPRIDNSKTGWMQRHRYNAQSLDGLKRIILKILSKEDDVWIWSKRKAIHSSDFDGFPATNREIDIYSFVMYEIKDRQIYRAYNLDDDLRGFVQIGKVILEENDKVKIEQYMSQLRKIGLVR